MSRSRSGDEEVGGKKKIIWDDSDYACELQSEDGERWGSDCERKKSSESAKEARGEAIDGAERKAER